MPESYLREDYPVPNQTEPNRGGRGTQPSGGMADPEMDGGIDVAVNIGTTPSPTGPCGLDGTLRAKGEDDLSPQS